MSVIITHHLNGTVGQPVSASGEGYSYSDGVVPTYASGGVSGGVSAHFDGSLGYGSLVESQTVEYSQLYMRLPSAPTGDMLFYRITYGTEDKSAALIGVHSSRKLYITSAFSEVATALTVLTVGSWYRLEWHVGAAGQELRLFTQNGTTPLEILTGATAGGPPAQYYLGLVTQLAGVVDVDEASLGDSWFTDITANTGAYVYNGSQFIHHTPYVYDGNSWQEYDLQ